MFGDILFYIVFLSQIILVSYYYPRLILSKVKYILDNYEPAQYPKLYLKPGEYYEKMSRNFRIINQVILIFGFLILIGIVYSEYSANMKRLETISFLYFFFQVFPFFLMEIFGFSYFKLMRKANLQPVRKAELKPRRLFDYISPRIIILAIFTNLSCITFFSLLHGFQFHISNATFIIVIALTASNALYGAIIFWNLYGKKLDPHRAGKDRIKQIEMTVKSLVFMSIGASLFIMISESIDQFNLEYLEPVIMSLYLQFVILIGLGYLLHTLKIENIDFEVYKENASVNQ